jgi:predicted enzyme involved in methoxymalonyl-ACP biosynthesis
VSDRFGDHGLVGAAVIQSGEIVGLAVSCRVLGMGVEHRFLKAILESAGQPLVGRIIETPRNNAVRNLYRDNGFIQRADGAWTREAQQSLTG